MKTWILARASLPCGGCRSRIAVNTPMLEITNGLGARLARCPVCAKHIFGLEPPAEIVDQGRVAPQPSLPVSRLARRSQGFESLRNVGREWVDTKARQIAREPGEDG